MAKVSMNRWAHRLGRIAFPIVLAASVVWPLNRPERQFQRIASDEYMLRAKRMDAIAACWKTPGWKVNWNPNAVNADASAEVMKRCMRSGGYEFRPEQDGCGSRPTERWQNWPQSDSDACYRSVSKKIREREDVEPKPLPWLGAP